MKSGAPIRKLLGARRPKPSTGSGSRRAFSMRRPASMAAGFPTRPATPASMRSTAMSRPGAASRRRSSTTAPSRGRQAAHQLRRIARRGRRRSPPCSAISASSKAIASSSTCRWFPRRWSAMLACARIGAVHSVVFGGFAAKELATRIDDAQPKLVSDRLLRPRAGPHRPIQAAARWGDRPCPA